MDLKKLLSLTRDRIHYVISYAPDFPEEDVDGFEGNFTKILEGLEAAAKSNKRKEDSHWLDLAVSQVRLAKEHYNSDQIEDGRKSLEFASDYFENYLKGKPAKPRFAVDPTGVAAESSNDKDKHN